MQIHDMFENHPYFQFVVPGILAGLLVLLAVRDSWLKQKEEEKAAREYKKRMTLVALCLFKAEKIKKQTKILADALRQLAE